MAQQLNQIITSQNVDLTNCDRELIQFSGAVQPHSALLVLSEPELRIVQASANTGTLLGIPAEALLGQPVSVVLEPTEEAELRAKIGRSALETPLHFLRISRNGYNFHLFVHRAGGLLLLEWESNPTESDRPTQDLYTELRNNLAELQGTRTLAEFFHLAVDHIRRFTGFDRVLAYQFLPDKSGKVIAEAKQEKATSYLGHHYPASDIPEPARRLFTLLWLRHLPDVNYQPSAIVADASAASAGPVDLSYVGGRSVSAMYSKYLQNMGVRATMVITLLKQGKLWGLISCMHHSGPRPIPYDVRLACEFLAHMVSFLMDAKEEEENRAQVIALRENAARLVNQMSTQEPFHRGLFEGEVDALSILGAGGAATVMGGEVRTLGVCPAEADLRQITAWLDETAPEQPVFCSDRLPEQMSGAEQFKAVASGLMAVRIGSLPSGWVLWFRPEMAHSITWAGDPSKPVEVQNLGGEDRLLPRSSFEIWKQEISGRAHPWTGYEIQTMRELQQSITEVKKVEGLLALNRELAISNSELESFAYAASHDLKEPLRGIHNYSTLVLRKAGEALDPDSRVKMETIQRLTRRMDELIEALLHYSRVGRMEMLFGQIDLNEVLADALDALSTRMQETGTEIRLQRPLPSVLCDPIRVREVFTNLISNALKFNDKSTRWIEIGWERQEPPVFWIRDNGIGIANEFHEEIFRIFRRLHGRDELGGGTGAGLTIVRRIVERHGGRIWLESEVGDGTKFLFTLAGESQHSARPHE